MISITWLLFFHNDTIFSNFVANFYYVVLLSGDWHELSQRQAMKVLAHLKELSYPICHRYQSGFFKSISVTARDSFSNYFTNCWIISNQHSTAYNKVSKVKLSEVREYKVLLDLYINTRNLIFTQNIAHKVYNTNYGQRIAMCLFVFRCIKRTLHCLESLPCLLKVNSGNSRKRCKICSKLTIKTSEQCQWCGSVVIIVNFNFNFIIGFIYSNF